MHACMHTQHRQQRASALLVDMRCSLRALHLAPPARSLKRLPAWMTLVLDELVLEAGGENGMLWQRQEEPVTKRLTPQ